MSDNLNQVTMKQVVESTRETAAANSWQRARQASWMRKLLRQEGKPSQSKICAAIKIQAIRQLLQIAPESIQVSIDDVYQVGLLQVRYKDGSTLHLPLDTNLDDQGFKREAS
jgi:hypothetical protein